MCGVFFDLIRSFRANEGSNIVIICLIEFFVSLDKHLELILIPMMEMTLGLCLRQPLIQFLQQFLIPILSFSFLLHVDLKLNVFDELMLDVELEYWELSVPIEFCPFAFAVLIVPSDQVLVFVFFGVNIVIIILFLVKERIEITASFDGLLELHADLFFFLFVLCLAQG